MNKTKEIVILMAEDDNGHADLIKENLIDAGVRNKVIRFKNGTEILDFLYNGKEFSEYTYCKNHSYLILLDIQMPEIDGIEVLKKLKSDSDFKNIPIIMLTTTDDSREIKKSYELGCNCYITKPIDFKLFSETLKRLGLFILIIQIPENNEVKNNGE